VGGVAVAAGELLEGVLPHALDARRSSAETGIPSGISPVRQGASRPSRSTRRSTVIFAIRRQVVSLPPVIVTIPLEVSYSSALREMSTDFFGSPVEISGPHPGVGPRDVAGAQLGAEEGAAALSRYSTSDSAGWTWSMSPS
jgi:hypothetical protein